MAKIASKMSFPFNFAKIERAVILRSVGQKKLKLSPETLLDNRFQENVLASLLLFFFVIKSL